MSTWFGKKQKQTKAKPDCPECLGTGFIYKDGYWGDTVECGCSKCDKCKDTGYYNNVYDIKTPCACTYDCKICNRKGWGWDYSAKMPCSCVFGIWWGKNQEAKKGFVDTVVEKMKADGYFDNQFKLDNSKEAIVEKMAKKGKDLEIVVAKPNQLQLDYDQDEVPEQFHKMLPILRQRFARGQITWSKYRSSSGKHWHVIVNLPEDINDQERILWQSVFGSDCMREALSILRVAAHMSNPTLLFMPKNAQVIETGVLEERPARKFKELDAT